MLSKSQTLIMNEVSNGISGSGAGTQEYVEFVVVSNSVVYDCNSSTPPCLDIRGWIFDDNSGYHGPSGIASGAVRFSFDPLWSCVPLGTMIVIYNSADRNPTIPPDDLSLTDGNCRIIAPINNTSLFDRNTTTPGAAACSYPATGWVAGGDWTNTALANPSDCARVVNLAGCEVFSVCYGAADNQNTLIYFAPAGTSTVYYFNGVDPTLQSNWSSGLSASFETPGAPNNAANAAYINQLNNGCAPITPINVTASSVNASCTCNGTATATATGSIPGYTYTWYDAAFVPIGQTSATATGLCAGVYTVVATSFIGCADTAAVTITSTAATLVTVNSQSICSGATGTLTASPSITGGTYFWTPGGQTTQTISITPAATTTYTVSYTLASCTGTGTGTGTITVSPLPLVSVNAATICDGAAATLTAAGATTYAWNTGSTLNPLSVSPTTTTSYTVTGTASGCSSTAVATVTVLPSPTIAFNADLTSGCAPLCVHFSDQSTFIGGTINAWNWNFGDGGTDTTSNPNHCFQNAGSYSVALSVTSNTGCSNSLTQNNYVNVFPIPDAQFSSNLTQTDIFNSTITFNNQSTDASIFQWSFGDAGTSNLTNPIYTYNNEGQYSVLLIATSSMGCIDSIFHTIDITSAFTFFAPNAFTPNDDNTNNVFLPKGMGWNPDKYLLMIFDRWGNLCFQTNDMNLGWDGKTNQSSEIAQEDVYVWKVVLTDIFDKKHKYMGAVTIAK